MNKETKEKPKVKDTMLGRVPEFSDAHSHRERDYTVEQFDYDHNPSWRIFRIMAEFVDGFHFVSQYKRAVTFFGSARLARNSKYYRDAQTLARLLSRDSFTIISGGGPGIMEAANKGAVEGKKGKSIGLNIQLPFEQRINPYVRQSMAFNYFFTRKVMLAYSAEAYIFFPGGYGTMDEFFEILTLRQTHKINPQIPIVLIERDYWQPLCDWLEKYAFEKNQTIDEEDLRLWKLVDTPEEAYRFVKKHAVKRRFT